MSISDHIHDELLNVDTRPLANLAVNRAIGRGITSDDAWELYGISAAQLSDVHNEEASMKRGNTAKILGLISGTTELRASLETAANKKPKVEVAARDTLLLQTGNVEYRYYNMIARRKVAALAMQHREMQRLDKEIAILRAALGMPQMAPEEVVRTHVTSRDPSNGTSLEVSSAPQKMWNADWARGVTVRSLAQLRDTLLARGYAYNHIAKDTATIHEFAGLKNGVADLLEVSTISNAWCATASRNGKALKLFNFNPTAATDIDSGIPLEMTASTWDGSFDSSVAQQYSKDWATLIREA